MVNPAIPKVAATNDLLAVATPGDAWSVEMVFLDDAPCDKADVTNTTDDKTIKLEMHFILDYAATVILQNSNLLLFDDCFSSCSLHFWFVYFPSR